MTINWPLAILGAVLGWLVLSWAVLVLSDAAPGVLVLFPTERLLEGLSDDVSILGQTEIGLTLHSEAPGLAMSLVKSGAFLILPAGLKGCVPDRLARLGKVR